MKDIKTGGCLCGSKEYHILEKFGYKIGFIGLGEYDWIPMLPDPIVKAIEYEDFIDCAKRLVPFLRNEKKCDLIIVLTHMRSNSDTKLAEEIDNIDIILGGHDHINVVKEVNGTYFVKSGCEFKEFNVLTLNKTSTTLKKPLYKGKFTFTSERVEVDSKWEPNP